jgi:hypothetical protein
MATERDLRDVIPEVLAAAGCAAIYCAQPEVWDGFEQWLCDTDYLLPEEKIDKDFMLSTASILAQLIREVETELLASKFEEYLKESGGTSE